MSRLHLSVVRILRIAAIVLALPAAGCHTWERAEASGIPDSPTVVQLQTRDGSRITLRNVEARGDTVFGENPSCRWTLALGHAPGRAWCSGVAIARAELVDARVRVPAPFRTNVAILVLGLLWCAVVVACLELFAEGRRERRDEAENAGTTVRGMMTTEAPPG